MADVVKQLALIDFLVNFRSKLSCEITEIIQYSDLFKTRHELEEFIINDKRNFFILEKEDSSRFLFLVPVSILSLFIRR